MFTTRPLTLAMATLLATAPLATLAQGKDPVRVGLVTSKSGVFAQQGEEVLRAVQFAIDEANAAGGVDGRKVENKKINLGTTFVCPGWTFVGNRK